MEKPASENPASLPAQRRVIKRYSNRKLYDTTDSTYVTLLHIAEMVRRGEDVQIIDNATKEDKTDVTLALIISEELKARPRGIPLATLKALIRQRSGKFLTQLRGGPIGKLMPKDEQDDDAEATTTTETSSAGATPAAAAGAPQPGPVPPLPPDGDGVMTEPRDGQGKGLRATLEQWQHGVDERIRAVLPNFSAFRDLQQQVKTLNDRVSALEARLTDQKAKGRDDRE